MKNRKTPCIIALLCTASLLASCGPQNNEPAESTVQTDAPASVTEVSETAEVSEVPETSESTAAASVSETEVSVSETAVSVSETDSAVTSAAETNAEASPSPENNGGNQNSDPAPDNNDNNSNNTESTEPESGDVVITLNGDSAECSSSKVSVNGSTVTINAEGLYKVSGSLNGQIVVSASKEAKVDIELSGVNISCSDGPAIFVNTADKVKIITAGGTDNNLSDGGSSEACIFSKEDITLKGDGFLRLNGNVKNAVQSKNTLKITGGTIEANSPNNGLVGKDKVAIEGGNITVNCSRDAIKSTNESEGGKGVVYVTGGNININAGDDMIQAISEVIVNNCSISGKAEGKKVNCTGNLSVDDGCITKIK